VHARGMCDMCFARTWLLQADSGVTKRKCGQSGFIPKSNKAGKVVENVVGQKERYAVARNVFELWSASGWGRPVLQWIHRIPSP
jgi:hypothetical protein